MTSYQPRAAFQIFNRGIHDLDIATREHRILTSVQHDKPRYATSGPQDSYVWTNDVPAALPAECILYDIVTACTVNQVEGYLNGSAEVEGWVVVRPEGGGGPIGGSAASWIGRSADMERLWEIGCTSSWESEETRCSIVV